MDKLKQGAEQIRQAHTCRLVAATTQVLSATVMPPIIKLFPGVTIDFHTLNMAEIMESIQAQRLDIGGV